MSQVVADILRQNQTQPTSIEPLQPSMAGHDQCSGTVPKIISDNWFAQTLRYDNDFDHMVPNRLKIKIVNGEYVNLGKLVLT